MESITHVATLAPDGRMWTLQPPNRHHNCFRVMQEDGFIAWGTERTGFYTSDGRYVDREEAWKIAVGARQLNERAPTDGRGGTLYSEDVW